MCLIQNKYLLLKINYHVTDFACNIIWYILTQLDFLQTLLMSQYKTKKCIFLFVLGTGLQNLRECIVWTQTKHDFEPKKKRPFWKQMSKNFIERYVYLILFTTYAKAFFLRGKFFKIILMLYFSVRFSSVRKNHHKITLLNILSYRFWQELHSLDGWTSRTSRSRRKWCQKLQLDLTLEIMFPCMYSPLKYSL